MTRKTIKTVINEKISPYSLNTKGESTISKLTRMYEYNFLLECIDIGVDSYFQYDEDGNVTEESVSTFLNKLSGIAYNKTRDPIDKEVYHLKNKCKKFYINWDDDEAERIFYNYVVSLKSIGYSSEQIANDLRTEISCLCNKLRSIDELSEWLSDWADEIQNLNEKGNFEIKQNGTILPATLFGGLPFNFQCLCKQINASYENNLYDCSVVMMRRLLEGLLILAYQNKEIESEITDKNDKHYITLNKIIKNAENNQTLKLSADTKKSLSIFKDLGNYSSHKIWYNCTKSDIDPHLFKYRIIIEELLYKSGLRN